MPGFLKKKRTWIGLLPPLFFTAVVSDGWRRFVRHVWQPQWWWQKKGHQHERWQPSE